MSRREALRALRALVLGETWTLPLAVAATVLAATALRLTAGAEGWWSQAGGAVVLALVVASLTVSLPRAPARNRGGRR